MTAAARAGRALRTEAGPDRVAAAEWPLWSTTAHLVVTDPAALDTARRLIDDYLSEVDAACSRFRPDSEINRLTARPGRAVRVSALLADYLRAALQAAADTDGDVDPTIGSALVRLGYDRDITRLPTDPARQTVRGVHAPAITVLRPDWTSVLMRECVVAVPAGVLLDLGATAKALAADRCAALVDEHCGCGVLVNLGGDIATAGPAPEGGWQVVVEDRPGEPRCRITLPAGAALATSSTLHRRWSHGGSAVHHILDPRTGLAAAPEWRTVSVAAGSCLAANTAATAAIVRGRGALEGLRRSGVPARLVDHLGRVTVLGHWPGPETATADSVTRKRLPDIGNRPGSAPGHDATHGGRSPHGPDHAHGEDHR